MGTALVQLAKAAGKRVIGVVSSDERAAFARAQGADDVVDRKRGDLVEQVKGRTGGRGVDLVLDPAGGPNMTRYFECLDRFGMLILYGRLEGPPAGNIDAAISQSAVAQLGLPVFHDAHAGRLAGAAPAKCTHELIRLLANGTIKVPIYERIPLAEARAHRVFESGQVMGKLIMKP